MKRLIAAVLFFLLIFAALPARSEEPLKLGVLAYRPKEQIATQWQPLTAYLETAIGQRIELKAYDYKELNTALAQNKVDILLTNSGHYILVKHRFGLSAPLATLVNKEGEHEIKAFGGVIFTRAEARSIGSLADLGGRRIAAVARDALGGYQMQAVELLDAKVPLPGEGNLISTGLPQDEVVKVVLDGQADAGFVRTGLLESMAREGKLDLGRIKIINRQNLPAFPFASSTRLYPEWPVAVMPHIDEHLSQRLTIALLTLQPDNMAARAAMIHGFIAPANYDGVENMLRRLGMPPFKAIPEFTVGDLWRKYSAWIVAVVLLVFLLVVLYVWLLLVSRARVRAMDQLAGAEERWSFALEGSEDGVWDWNLETGEVSLTKAGAAMFGYAEGEAGNNISFWYAQLYPDDAPRWDEMLRNFFRSKAGKFSMEYRVRCKDGGYKWVLTRGMVVRRAADGKIQRMIGVHTDITGRRQIEDSLRNLTAAIEQSPASVVITDLDANIQYVNPWFTKTTGYSIEEALGKNPRILQSGQTPREIYDDLWSKLTRGREWRGELLNKSKNGELYWEDVRIAPVKNAAGATTHYVAVKMNITAQKQVEAVIRDSEARLQATLDNSPYLIWQKDTEGRFIAANLPFLKAARLEQLKDILGKTDLDLWPRELAEKYRHDDAEVMATLQKKVVEEQALDGDRLHWVETFKTPILDKDGKLLGTTGFAQDITERRQHIEGLRKAQELSDEIATTKSNFLANMSHEIRTPMNAIIGLSQLALNKQLSAEVRSYLEKILDSSGSLMDILNDILDLSKIEAGRITIEQTPFNLDTILENLGSLFAARAESKFLDFNIDVSPDVPRNLVGDALRLQQVLSNLVGNAIKFTEHGKVVFEISLQDAGKGKVRLLFSVADTGIGIAKENLGKLFVPFSQVDSSITRRFGGTGLGLAISNDLLKLMGSGFRVESSPGKGSTFSFELVLGVASSAAHKQGDRRRRQRKAGALTSGLRNEGLLLAGSRILVVEDDAINQQVVSEFLGLANATVAIASNGKEAIELLEHTLFDAVLMDVHMPVMNGIEAAQHIRRQPCFSRLPIIALTADIASEARENYLSHGMNDFVAKPIDPEVLIATLARWIRTVKGGIDRMPATAAVEKQETGMGPDLDSLPSFDFGNLQKMVNGNHRLMADLLFSFKDNTAGMPGKIEASVNAGDFKAAREIAHKLKGTASNLGAKHLHAATAQLERELKAGQCAPGTLAAFQDEFNRTISAITGLRQHESKQPAHEQSSEAFVNIAHEIDMLLRENSFVASETLNKLKASLPADKQGQFAELRKCINNIEYASARQALRALAELPDTQES